MEITKFYDYNSLSFKKINELKKLTISEYSGMNVVLKELENYKIIKNKVKAKIICHYVNSKIVSWALLTREKTSFFNEKTWNPKKGYWIQIYTQKDFRSKGIAGKIIKRCNKYIKSKVYYASMQIPGAFKNLKKGISIY